MFESSNVRLSKTYTDALTSLSAHRVAKEARSFGVYSLSTQEVTQRSPDISHESNKPLRGVRRNNQVNEGRKRRVAFLPFSPTISPQPKQIYFQSLYGASKRPKPNKYQLHQHHLTLAILLRSDQNPSSFTGSLWTARLFKGILHGIKQLEFSVHYTEYINSSWSIKANSINNLCEN